MVNYQQLARLFDVLGYEWKVGGKMIKPTAKDLETTLDKAKKRLYDEPVPSQMQVGRLIITRYQQDKFDVYLYVGNDSRESTEDDI